MYMIEIILLNQSKHSLLGVIRQIPLHEQFRVILFDNFNDISTFTTTHYTMSRMQWVIYISNKSQYLKNDEDMENYRWSSFQSFQEFFRITNILNFHFKYTLTYTMKTGPFLA